MVKEEKVSPDALISWKKHPDGEIFWETLRNMFSAGVHNLRASIKAEKFHEASRYAAHVETLEEILSLPEKILDEQGIEQTDEEAEK